MVSLVINPCFSSSCSQFTFFFEDPFCFARSHLWKNKNFSLSMLIFKILGILGLLTSHSTLDHFFKGESMTSFMLSSPHPPFKIIFSNPVHEKRRAMYTWVWQKSAIISMSGCGVRDLPILFISMGAAGLFTNLRTGIFYC